MTINSAHGVKINKRLSLIHISESTAGVSLSEEEENRIIKIVKQIKDSDIDEEQLRSCLLYTSLSGRPVSFSE